MPLTAAEKMRKKRQKLKDEGKYEEYKLKHRETTKKYRERKKLKEQALGKREKKIMELERKKQGRERVAKYRKKLKETSNQNTPETSNTASPPFKNSSSLGKATARVKRALPKSPRKKTVVIKKLFESYVQPLPTSTAPSTAKSSNPDTRNAVIHFYENDEISRQAPGRKDVVTIRENKNKTKMQIRHLMFSLAEAHAMFCHENGTVIGRSKFAELRPKHVMLSNKLPHNVCLCRYHENFIDAVNALHKFVPEFPEYTNDLPKSFVCKDATINCWFGECETCKDLMPSKLNEICAASENSSDVNWFVWKECDGRLLKVQEDGQLQDLVDHILTIGPPFLEHCYLKRAQSKAYQTERAAVESTPHVALIQVDFSENYTCTAQDEIQSAQVSLFTAAIWHSGVVNPGYVIASDVLDHSKNTVIAYIDRLLEELPPSVSDVRIWSDGPSSQFKNRYIAEAMITLANEHKKKISLNYFATSHGKGPVDGIGGAIKRQIWLKVKSRKSIVHNATDFVNAVDPSSKVHVILMNSEEIVHRNHKLNVPSLVKNCKPFPNIAKTHNSEICNGETIGHITTAETKFG
ncbi:uncharacterized protein LOC134535630 [Bacillus rossius redtenbacheri]|uniref:uncharacterized protein LOC134535630 n=1 Tax=Bacillus rossius redtenbacheri TaxID=93214 RepID=UPI002FDE2EA9